MAAKIRLSVLGEFFATRHRAREIRSVIEALPPGQPAVIDWHGVQGMTGAFADELAGKLADGPRPITHTGMCDQVAEAVETALQRRREAA